MADPVRWRSPNGSNPDMCGFAGISDSGASRTGLEEAIRRMNASLAPRGPDAEGLYIQDGIALGHRRLSILDLSPSGAQPMSLAPGGPTLAFNGEVYNFIELRKELEGLGHAFRGHSDTEVMLHSYAEWGLEGLKRFEGIFAFALWDPAEKRLVLMRDRLGVKPLFYGRSGERLVFGSEIKALLAAGGLDPSMDEQALSEYLWYGNAFEDRTIYRSIRPMPPGHWLIQEKGRARLEAWWSIEEWLANPPFNGDYREAVIAVQEAVDYAVKRQLVADVPVGIFLSGGIDSSAIAASAMIAQSKPLSSYSVGFDFDRGIDELPKARSVANHLGLDHHEVRITGTDLGEVLVAMVRAHDEPFADAANIPLYLLSRQIRGKIKVVLQGDGGDEMFAGYRRYSMLRNSGLWALWPQLATPLIRRFGMAGKRFARMADALCSRDPAMRMALLMTTETLQDPPVSFLRIQARERLESGTDPFLGFRRCAERFGKNGVVERMLLTDAVLQLPSQFLSKVDRSTMACGLEARVPLLDENVARLAFSLPIEFKVSPTRKKMVLRDSLKGRIPDAIVNAPKTGFGVPYGAWLKGPLHGMARSAVLEGRFLDRFGFDRKSLEKALDEHQNGLRDRGFTLWKIFQLALWSRERP